MSDDADHEAAREDAAKLRLAPWPYGNLARAYEDLDMKFRSVEKSEALTYSVLENVRRQRDEATRVAKNVCRICGVDYEAARHLADKPTVLTQEEIERAHAFLREAGKVLTELQDNTTRIELNDDVDICEGCGQAADETYTGDWHWAPTGKSFCDTCWNAGSE